MHTLLKRLSIIQSAIALADAELIEMQSPLLRRFAEAHADTEAGVFIDTLLADLAAGRFADAEQVITQFLQSQHQLVLHEDYEWAALQWEADTLSRQLADLQQQKDDLLGAFEDFNYEYHQRLGEKLERILALRKQLAQQQMEAVQKATQRFQEAKEAYREAKQAFETFQEQSREQAQHTPSDELDEAERKRLKKAYR